MKEIARFHDPAEAQIARGYLRAQGFDVKLADVDTLGAQPHLRFGLDGYRLLASQAEAHTARIALEQVQERELDSALVCPVCAEGVMKNDFGFLDFLAELFLPQRTKYLRCTACGHRQAAEPQEETP